MSLEQNSFTRIPEENLKGASLAKAATILEPLGETVVDTLVVKPSIIDFKSYNPSYGQYIVTDVETNVRQAITNEITQSSMEVKNREGLEAIREECSWFSKMPEVNKAIDEFFEVRFPAPEILKNTKMQSAKSWSEWLAEDADDLQLTNFLQWHTFSRTQRAISQETIQSFETLKTEYLAKIAQLESMGLLHEETNVLPKDLNRVHIALEDIFQSYMFGNIGFTNLERDSMQIVESDTGHTLNHELNHAVLGRIGEYMEETWLDEAITEHLTQVMNEGEPLIINPAERKDRGEAYRIERGVLAAVINYAGTHDNDPLTLRDFTRCYSAVSAGARTKARALINEKAERIFGDVDIFKKINTYLNNLLNQAETEEQYEDAARNVITDPLVALTTQST